MEKRQARRRKCAFSALLLGVFLAALGLYTRSSQSVLRIRDWQNNEILLEVRARPGDRLYFGWIHSFENIPWHEYYYISDNLTLILDTIAFPSFGAGIPENRGQGVRIEGGLIYMYGINDEFEQLLWLNSHEYTQGIKINGGYLTRGNRLPQRRLTLRIERRGF
jgi:hypothetical protein